MRRWLFTALLTLTMLPLLAQYTTEHLRIDLSPDRLSSFTHDHLMIIPVRSAPQFNAYFAELGNFTVLKKAMENDKVVVKEVSASGSVNTLVAVNRSGDTIFGMAGEVVKGGKQDRVIAQNFLMQPGDSINLSAFCVEKGRWAASGGAFRISSFEETKAVGAQSLRKTTMKDTTQQAVWDKVEEVAVAHEAASGTGTYTALWDSDTLERKLKPYQENFDSAFHGQSDVIGFIAVTGDTVLGCDLFATHDLFINTFSGLLESYATEAVTSGSPVTIEVEEIESYIDRLLSSEARQAEYIEEHGAIFEHNGLKLQLTGF